MAGGNPNITTHSHPIHYICTCGWNHPKCITWPETDHTPRAGFHWLPLKGHCMGLNLPLVTAKFGRPARRQHRQYLKISCWRLNKTRTHASLFQSITDVSTTALSRITFKSHELKIATTVIMRHACLVSCRSFCRQDILVLTVLPLAGRPHFLPLRVEGSIPYSAPLKGGYQLLYLVLTDGGKAKHQRVL